MWVEHDPSGIKRYYGLDVDGNRAQIVNELGTHTWLLLSEVDVDGNHISYEYHHIEDQDRDDLAKPQRVPVLKRVAWGGNRIHNKAHIFQAIVEIGDQEGGLDMLQGHVLLSSRVDQIRIEGPGGQLYWTYELAYEESADTHRILLKQVRREAPGEAPRVTDLTYSQNAPGDPRFVEMGQLLGDCAAPVDERDRVYATVRQWPGELWFPTVMEALTPPDLLSAHKFLDFDGDGDTDVVYHPAGITTVSSGVRLDRSFLQEPGWEFTAFQDLASGSGVQENIAGIPSSELISQIGDLDGDFDLDAVSFPVAYSYVHRAGTGDVGIGGSIEGDIGDLCCSEGFWNKCGMVDPIPELIGIDFTSPADLLEARRRWVEEILGSGTGGGCGPWLAGDHIYAPVRYDPSLPDPGVHFYEAGMVTLDQDGTFDIPGVGTVDLWDPNSLHELDLDALATPAIEDFAIPASGKALIVQKRSGVPATVVDLGTLRGVKWGKADAAGLRSAAIRSVDEIRINDLGDVSLPNKAQITIIREGVPGGEAPDHMYLFFPSDLGGGGAGPDGSSPGGLEPPTGPGAGLVIVLPGHGGTESPSSLPPNLDCLGYIKACFAGNHNCGLDPYDNPYDDLFGDWTDVAGQWGSTFPACEAIGWGDFQQMPISTFTNQSRDTAPSAAQQQTLEWWPAGVGHRVEIQPQIPMEAGDLRGWDNRYQVEAIRADFMAPLADVNADGRADLVLLKYMNRPEWLFPTYKFLPRTYIAKGGKLDLDLDFATMDQICESFREENPKVTDSEFTKSLIDILSGGYVAECSGDYAEPECVLNRPYPHSVNYNSMLMDVNSDGLPDLVVARPPEWPSALSEEVALSYTIEDVKRATADYYHLSVSHLSSTTPARLVSDPREVGMYVAAEHTDASRVEIARAFGETDVAVVDRAIARVESRLLTDADLKKGVAQIGTKLTTLQDEGHKVAVDGHVVYINRGYRWDKAPLDETWSSPMPYDASDLRTSPLLRLLNRDRLVGGLPLLQDADYLTTNQILRGEYRPLSMAAMATVDINADGRLDIVFAYRQLAWLPSGQLDTTRTTIRQEVFRNTGRGYVRDGSDYGFPENLYLAGEAASLVSPGWIGTGGPKANVGDAARFVDVDSDGLVDIVMSGYLVPDVSNPPRFRCLRPTVWYRNQGVVPDQLVRVEAESGAWVEIDYTAATSPEIQLQDQMADPGQLPAGHQVVQQIRRAWGPESPSGVLAEYRFPALTVDLYYDNYIRDDLSSEAIGFEAVVELHRNYLTDGTAGEEVTVTRYYDVQETIGSVTVRYPLKGLEVYVETKTGGNRAIERTSYSVSAYGSGARIRTGGNSSGECNTSACRWAASAAIQFDDWGYVTELRQGNGTDDSLQVIEDSDTVTTTMAYDHRIGAIWRLGLLSEELVYGFSQDIKGNPQAGKLLSHESWIYDDWGRLESERRLGITPTSYATRLDIPEDSVVTYTYADYGLVESITNNHHQSSLGTVSYIYDEHSLYVSAQVVDCTHYVSGMQTGTQVLTETFTMDLRTGEMLVHVDLNGQISTTERDSHGRPLVERGPGGLVLAEHEYFDAYPVRKISQVHIDATKKFERTEYLDGDGQILAAVESAVNSPPIRREYHEYDAFGRPTASYLPQFLSTVQEIAPGSADPKVSTLFDGFDRPLVEMLPDGRTGPRLARELGKRDKVRRSGGSAGCLHLYS
jgi:hypothetical protein